MKRILVFIYAIAPLLAFATDEVCPAGYYPAEYIELEYIESTGTQYIDTGFVNNNIVNIKYVIDFAFTSLNKDCGLWGTLSSTRNGCVWLSSSSQKFVISAGNTQSTSSSVKINADFDRHVGIVDIHYISGTSRYNFEFDGTNYSGTFSSSDYYSTGSINLFRSYLSSSYAGAYAKIYMFQIYTENVLVRDFIPVRRLSDGAVGMFDKVEGKFYGNSGTGEFIAGPEIGDSITTQHRICVSCPANTYKPNAGNESCTKCPTGTFSPVGSTQLSDCAKILRINDYVVYMPLGKRTEHGLCVMWNGEKYCADVYKKQ